ncbi:MAG TPA: asparagine synthetase B [Firmicutes bacterium]|nr:asparagine synthetase B [Bacillota bacterium]
MKRIFFSVLIFLSFGILVPTGDILVPMDEVQTNHLKAYGLAYWTLKNHEKPCEWLLNYRFGSFLLPDSPEVRKKAGLMGVKIEIVSPEEVLRIFQEIEENNMDRVLLEKAPKVAVYTPIDSYLKGEKYDLMEPWDDAVILALEYAEIPFDKIYDREILSGFLSKYDWVHLHHEDFTGQYGKFYRNYHGAFWYQKRVAWTENEAKELGFSSVQEFKGAIALKIREYVLEGGFLFAMCSACDTLDISLSAIGVDIVPPEIDKTPIDVNYQSKLNFNRCFAFENFKLITDINIYEFSDIDVSIYSNPQESRKEDFVLFEFSAKHDPVPTMLTQCHVRIVNGFFGQTTSFKESVLKDDVIVMGTVLEGGRVKYIHGNRGRGTFTFYGGHDPEDYSHYVGDPPTNLSLHKNSPGYRLILNNILFPAAKKKQKKT